MNKSKWLLLTHQLPATPSKLRVMVWRRLQAIGAVPIKNSIYVLPNRPAAKEDFEWLRKEITQMKGAASVFLADSISDVEDAEIVRTFQEARAKEFDALIQAARGLTADIKDGLSGGYIKETLLDRLEKRLSALKTDRERLLKVDFFGAPNRRKADQAVAAAQKFFHELRALSGKNAPEPPPSIDRKTLKGKIWVTRASPHIDRLATAWLVRRFLDPRARFKFVSEPYRAKGDQELRFDMVEAEFTHYGDWCTFETLLHRAGLDDPALLEVAEIVHDIDLKDKKFGRLEASGFSRVVQGLCRVHADDLERVAAGMTVFDALLASFQKGERSEG
jgi:hypothetical protein